MAIPVLTDGGGREKVCVLDYPGRREVALGNPR
jgi:hypothetical protein